MSVAMEHRPQQQQQHQLPHEGRPRSKSTFSFKSHHSHGSDSNRLDKKTSESGHARKASDTYKPHLNTTGKADPNAAMNESQPSTFSLSSSWCCGRIANVLAVAAALEKPTLQSLRSFQHTDKDGNPIGMLLLLLLLLTASVDQLWANGPQRSLTSPTPRAHDGNALSIPSVLSRRPSIVSIGEERARCVVRCPAVSCDTPIDPNQSPRRT